MDYCSVQFGKGIDSITLGDVERYFKEEHSETDQLELKSIRSGNQLNDMLAGIQRTVCAFLNSSGGLLIWGAPEGKKVNGRKEKIFTGELTSYEGLLEKDALMSKIADAITPLPSSIRIKILSVESMSVVVVEVQPSGYSPHQFSNTYYMRIDGQTKPAPHHYIEALFKKISYPHIEAFIKVDSLGVHDGTSFNVNLSLFLFNWSAMQNEETPFVRLVTEGIFVGWQNQQISNLYEMKGHSYHAEELKKVFYFGEPIFKQLSILFHPHEFSTKENKARLHVSFGGRFSPHKTSEYQIDLSNLYPANPQDILIPIRENKLTKDVQDEKGVSKESVVKIVMKKGVL